MWELIWSFMGISGETLTAETVDRSCDLHLHCIRFDGNHSLCVTTVTLKVSDFLQTFPVSLITGVTMFRKMETMVRIPEVVRFMDLTLKTRGSDPKSAS